MCLVLIHPQQLFWRSLLEEHFRLKYLNSRLLYWRCIDNLIDLNFEACDYIDVFFGTAIYQMMGQVRQ